MMSKCSRIPNLIISRFYTKRLHSLFSAATQLGIIRRIYSKCYSNKILIEEFIRIMPNSGTGESALEAIIADAGIRLLALVEHRISVSDF